MPAPNKRKNTDSASSYGNTPNTRADTFATTPLTDAPAPKRVKIEPAGNPTEPKGATPKKDMSNTLYNDIVFVKVGPTHAKFGVHRGLLTKASNFFKEILKPAYVNKASDVEVTREGETTVINLRGENPEIFARVNTWFYSSKFLTAGEIWKEVTWNHLISVYLFSREKEIGRLHNTCIDAAIAKTHNGGLFPGQETINALWKLDVRATPLRKLFVKLFAIRCDLKSALLNNKSYHQTFLNALVIELYEMQENAAESPRDDMWKRRVEYYVYGSDNPISLD